jgi:two-component system, cell cycle response regulator DivK
MKKVLVVDDDAVFLEEIQETLHLSGYDVVKLSDSRRVIEVAAREKPDVIVMDLRMPEKTGFQVADELKHDPDLLRIPVLAMTAYYKYGFEPLLALCGIEKCFKKPFHPLEIITEIERRT